MDVEAEFRADRGAQAAGIELVESGRGDARTALTIRPEQANSHGSAHGGVIFLLADTAVALACNSRELPQRSRARTAAQ